MRSPGISRSGPVVDIAQAVLRAVAGGLMAWHGWQKLDGGIANFAGFVQSLDLAAPTPLAYVVTFIELVGGTMVLLGLLSRLPALVLVIHMGFTSLLVKLSQLKTGVISPEGAGAELDLLFLAAFLSIFLIGPGRLSLDHVLSLSGERRSRNATAPSTAPSA